MKRTYLSLPARTKSEFFLSLLLSGAIFAVLLLPSSARQSNAAFARPVIFHVMESDYLQPRFASAKQIQALNRGGCDFFGFAGYDEFKSSVHLPSGKTVANITRFAGQLFSLLDVDFILRDRSRFKAPRIFLSEKLWAGEFGRDATAIGRELFINGVCYRIAGVVRGTVGLLGQTDVWMPISSREMMAESNCLRVVGAVPSDIDWKRASDALITNSESPWRELVRDVLRNPAFVPLERGLVFGGPEVDQEIIATAEAGGGSPTS